MKPNYQKLDAQAKELLTSDCIHAITLDTESNLMHAALPLKKDDGSTRFDFEEAEKACKELRLGGFNDWRLPTVKELFGVIDHEKYAPAIDTEAFPETQSTWHWTSTPGASAPEVCAWIVYFHDGHVDIGNRHGTACVRAVRSVSPPSQ